MCERRTDAVVAKDCRLVGQIDRVGQVDHGSIDKRAAQVMASGLLVIGPNLDNGESLGFGFGRPLICDNCDASVPAWMDSVSIDAARR
jgi:hypothetical protein